MARQVPQTPATRALALDGRAIGTIAAVRPGHLAPRRTGHRLRQRIQGMVASVRDLRRRRISSAPDGEDSTAPAASAGSSALPRSIKCIRPGRGAHIRTPPTTNHSTRIITMSTPRRTQSKSGEKGEEGRLAGRSGAGFRRHSAARAGKGGATAAPPSRNSENERNQRLLGQDQLAQRRQAQPVDHARHVRFRPPCVRPAEPGCASAAADPAPAHQRERPTRADGPAAFHRARGS
jgi:hypothetical protein